MSEVDPINEIEAITDLTDRFLETKAGQITDQVSGSLVAIAGFESLFVLATFAVNKTLGVELQPSDLLVARSLTTAPEIIAAYYGFKKLKPIKEINEAIKTVNNFITAK